MNKSKLLSSISFVKHLLKQSKSLQDSINISSKYYKINKSLLDEQFNNTYYCNHCFCDKFNIKSGINKNNIGVYCASCDYLIFEYTNKV